MIVSLYSIRVVLSELGLENYGLFNVIAGVVTMFSFISGSMISASQRFLAFEIGSKNIINEVKVFNTIFVVYILIVLIFLVLSETFGLWFIKNKLNVPVQSEIAIFWVYQFSVLSFVVSLISIPYIAALIAHENLKEYSIIGVVEVVLKAFVAYLLVIITASKLESYSILMFLVSILTSFLYVIVVKIKIKHYKEKILIDKEIFINIFKYSTWNIIGTLALILRQQGVNILQNVFFYASINSAHSISQQVSVAVNQFVNNIYIATRPQITKYYAENKENEMWKLFYSSNKYSYLILLVLITPIFYKTEYILNKWLGKYPELTPIFLRLMLVSLLIETSVNQIVAIFQAKNAIKNYQIVSSIIMLLNVPLSYLVLKYVNTNPIYPYYMSIFLSILYSISLVIVGFRKTGLNVKLYFSIVYFPILKTTFFVFMLCFLVNYFFNKINDIVLIIFFLFISTFLVFFLGIEKYERVKLFVIFKNRVLN